MGFGDFRRVVPASEQVVDALALDAELGKGFALERLAAGQADLQRIHLVAVDDHLVVQVRAGRKTG